MGNGINKRPSIMQLDQQNMKFPAAAADAAAKSHQLCPILCDPIDDSPPGSSVPGIFQARVLQWVAIAFSDEVPYSPAVPGQRTPSDFLGNLQASFGSWGWVA